MSPLRLSLPCIFLCIFGLLGCDSDGRDRTAPDGSNADVPTVDDASDGTSKDVEAKTSIEILETEPEELVFSPAPSGCEAPESPGQAPLTMVGEAMKTPNKSHLLDMQYDSARGLLLCAGVPGLAIFQDPRNTENAGLLGSIPKKYERLELLDDHLVALTMKGWSKIKNSTIPQGGPGGPPNMNAGIGQLALVDTADPSAPDIVGMLDLPDVSGMAARGDTLYVVGLGGQIFTVDISDPTWPRLVVESAGLGKAWEIVLVGNHAYVADSSMGLVVLSLEDSKRPEVIAHHSTASSALDLVHHKGFIYVAVGSLGVEIFSIDSPGDPTSTGVHNTGGAAISVAATGNHLWASNYEGISVSNISDPLQPVQLATYETESWAMHVDALDDVAFLANWADARVFEVDSAKKAPQAEVTPSSYYFTEGVRSGEVTLRNRGGDTLEIAGMQISDPRFSLLTSGTIAEPGERIVVKFELKDGESAEEINTDLCIATNAPQNPVQKVKLASTSSGTSVLIGEPAPNFILPDLNDELHELAEQIGSPILLSYFATW